MQTTLVDHYRTRQFNPVLIPVENGPVWQDHLRKRHNLYSRHLHMPTPLWRDARVLEFGANSGENSLVAAMWGAKLTLVEPNEQVHPRIHGLFRRFNLSDQLDDVSCMGVDDFCSEELYDIVLAEGFVFTLPNRNDVLKKIVSLIRPGGFGVVSFMDRIGGLLEALRKLYLRRACQLRDVSLDERNPEVPQLARSLFYDDFQKLSASRSFDAWWIDTLASPHVCAETLWSFPEIARVLGDEECEIVSTSPGWSSTDDFIWYKRVPSTSERHRMMIEECKQSPYFLLTGRPPMRRSRTCLSGNTFATVEALVTQMHNLHLTSGDRAPNLPYPKELTEIFDESGSPDAHDFDRELRKLFAMLGSDNLDQLMASWHSAIHVRNSWGAPYHYVSYQRTYPGLTH